MPKTDLKHHSNEMKLKHVKNKNTNHDHIRENMYST